MRMGAGEPSNEPPGRDRPPDATSPARRLASRIRTRVLEVSHRAGVGHIGSSLSIAEILATLYAGVLSVDGSLGRERDRFVLSKGHAALALYVALVERGLLGPEELDRFCTDGGRLGVHPERSTPGIDFSTGSLGQGLSYGAGAALAARLQGSPRRVFVLVSDAECNEGAVWETVMFAAHHRLDNLTAIVDVNGQQALGYTRDVLDLSPLAARWAAFGWHVEELDGHDTDALERALRQAPAGAPRVVLARTVFGKGVSFMEGLLKWHYWPLSDEELRLALGDVEARG